MKCTLVLSDIGHFNDAIKPLIGVDKGAYLLASKGIHMQYAIGDFDSVSQEEMKQIEQYSDSIIYLPNEKDETDTLAAIRYLKKLGYKEFKIIGAIYNRIDHSYANLLLMMDNEIDVTLYNVSSIITASSKTISISNEYRYVSIFALVDSNLSLSGFKYDLDHYDLDVGDSIGISNEVIQSQAIIHIHCGKVLIMQVNE
ncbi:thiamine diphosphokinase [Erysipelotrichaceae bacterium OH741_COT-311]|nr:thiamine diphosphokinase [Erysipelotrichaceae bacterium OH741_COT-311]